MCGRYYVNDDTAKEIEKMLENLEKRLMREMEEKNDLATKYLNQNNLSLNNLKENPKTSENIAKDIFPTNDAVVICLNNNQPVKCRMHWGIEQFIQQNNIDSKNIDNKKIDSKNMSSIISKNSSNSQRPIINARAETLTTKPTFKRLINNGRIVVPAQAFYEWDKQKTKYTFTSKKDSTLWLAGLYRQNNDECEYTIITTKPNKSMENIHDRMPLILSYEEVYSWLYVESEVIKLLNKVPELLKVAYEYKQMTLY